MEEVPTLIADLAVASRQFLLGTTPPMAALLPAVNLLMCRLDLLFGVPRETRVLNRGPIGEDSKGLHPQVNANGFHLRVEGQSRVHLIRCTEDCIPLVALALDGAGLDLPLDLSVQFDFDVTNLGEAQPSAEELITALRVRKAVIYVDTFGPLS